MQDFSNGSQVCGLLHEKPAGLSVKIYLFIRLSIIPFSNFISRCFLRFQGDRIGNCIPKQDQKKKKKVERSHGFLKLQAKKPPQQRSQRLSRGPSSHGDLSCSCVATAAMQVRLPGCLVAHRSTWGNAGNMGGELWVMVVTGQRCLFTPGCTQSLRGRLYIGQNRKLSVCTARIIHCFVWQRWQTWAGGGGIQTHHKSHASVLDFSCGG